MLVTERHKMQFQEEGYCLLSTPVFSEYLEDMREVCEKYVEDFNDSEPLDFPDGTPEGGEYQTRMTMDGRRIIANILNRKNSRYFLENLYVCNRVVRNVVHSNQMYEICEALLASDVYFFCDLFVAKDPYGGAKFGWHQDSGYVDESNRPYLTVWIALDDTSEKNGTIYVLPYSRAGGRDRVEHVRQPGTDDKIGYFGDDPGIPVMLPAGGAAVFSSTTFHRSGENRSESRRRAFITQYSPAPVVTESGGLLHYAMPFFEQGRRMPPAAVGDTIPFAEKLYPVL